MSIALLLQLQDCDQLLENSKKRLHAIPSQVATFEKKIELKEKELQQSNETHKRLQIKHRELEQQIKAADKKIKRYEEQQRTLQKQEASQALDREITLLRKNIDDYENEAIELLLQLEESEKKQEQDSILFQQEKEKWLERIDHLRVQEKEHRQEATQRESDFNQLAASMDTALVKTYQNLTRSVRHFPYISILEKQRCSGCHLRVSKEVLEEAILARKIVNCDQCSRIVYL